MRAGYQVFPISPRNSPQAVTHLLSKTNVQLLFATKGPMENLAAGAFEGLDSAQRQTKLVPMPQFEDLYPTTEEKFEPLPPYKAGLEDYCLILHSSGEYISSGELGQGPDVSVQIGSTAFPKPIKWTHHAVNDVALVPCTSI